MEGICFRKIICYKKGKRLTSAEQEDGGNNYIGAIDSNNGIANHISQAPIHKGNTISLSYNGSVGEAFYQKDPYWATDDVNVLYSKYEKFNEQIGLFIATVLRQEKYKFSYGRKWTLDNMNITIIKLPAQRNDDGTIYLDTSKSILMMVMSLIGNGWKIILNRYITNRLPLKTRQMMFCCLT